MRKHRQTPRSVALQSVGEAMKLGAIATPSEVLARVPFVHDYLDLQQVPLVPPQSRYSIGMHEEWGDLGNIEHADCIFAGLAHALQSMSANATGTPISITTDEVLGWYGEATGFRKDDSFTDLGATAVTGLNFGLQKGLIEAYGRVDTTRPDHMARASNIFGGLYTILYMPLSWKGKSTWDAGANLNDDNRPNSWGPHCVFAPDYNSSMTLTGISWGDPCQITSAATSWYMSEAFVIVTKSQLKANGVTIQGFRLDDLKQQLSLVA